MIQRVLIDVRIGCAPSDSLDERMVKWEPSGVWLIGSALASIDANIRSAPAASSCDRLSAAMGRRDASQSGCG
eukprot:3566043-Rhodomonas_salina.2